MDQRDDLGAGQRECSNSTIKNVPVLGKSLLLRRYPVVERDHFNTCCFLQNFPGGCET
jgi:hypothetical protein